MAKSARLPQPNRLNLPALLSPYVAAFLTAAIADGAPVCAALALFFLLSFIALVALSAVFEG